MGVVRAAIAAFVLGLAACGPKEETPSAPTFPEPTASYRAVYEASPVRSNAPLSPTIYASGPKLRIELNLGGRKQVTLLDSAARTVYSFALGDGMATTATKIDFNELARYNFASSREPMINLKKTGDDSVAGLPCGVWEATRIGAPAGAPVRHVCVTDDGILLRAGAKEAPRLQAVEVVRGPQDAALFAPPPNYAVTDLGDCMKTMAEYALSLRNGAAADADKFAECQKTIMSGRGAP